MLYPFCAQYVRCNKLCRLQSKAEIYLLCRIEIFELASFSLQEAIIVKPHKERKESDETQEHKNISITIFPPIDVKKKVFGRDT